MSKNVEINYKNEDGSYEALYPMVQYENVDGIVLPEAIVDTWDGAVVVASNGNKSSSGIAEEGKAVLDLPGYGNWNLSSTYGSFTGAGSINIDTVKQYTTSITVNMPTLTVTTLPNASVTVSINTRTLTDTASSSGTITFNIPEYGTCNVTASIDGRQGTGSVEITQITGYNLSVFPMPTSFDLSNLTWAEISYWAGAGYATSFSVGDNKQINLNGSAGSLSFNNTTVYATIIGINHNSAREGNNRLHFQLALDSGNTRLLGNAQMNSLNTNNGGWTSCQMRTRECANLINCLPSDLRAVVKTTTKYTSAGNKSNNIVSSSDKIFLLSEFEIFGTTTYSVSGERRYQQQYSWYTSHSKVKYSSSGSAYHWWERSPYQSNSTYFCFVNSNGNAYDGDANLSLGVAPCLCI